LLEKGLHDERDSTRERHAVWDRSRMEMGEGIDDPEEVERDRDGEQI
jgi:hypothetical protein